LNNLTGVKDLVSAINIHDNIIGSAKRLSLKEEDDKIVNFPAGGTINDELAKD
jgi:hypothetical protein